MRRRRLLLILLGVALYVGGYVVSRATGAVVHYAGYRTEADVRVLAEHRVMVGGLHDVASRPQSGVPALVFSPLRWLEQAAWYVIEPPGSVWGDEG